MWRDTVRRELNLATRNVDFLKVWIGEHEPLFIYNELEPSRAVLWEDILTFVNSSLSERHRVHYVLRVTDPDEDYTYEYDGPPLALSAEVQLGTDGDVEVTREVPSDIDEDLDIDSGVQFNMDNDGKRSIAPSRTGKDEARNPEQNMQVCLCQNRMKQHDSSTLLYRLQIKLFKNS